MFRYLIWCPLMVCVDVSKELLQVVFKRFSKSLCRVVDVMPRVTIHIEQSGTMPLSYPCLQP